MTRNRGDFVKSSQIDINRQKKEKLMQPVQASSSHSVIIQVKHLSHVITTRATKTTILDDLSFLVPEHSLFAITGPSGSGKSTLLNMLTGIDHSTSGRVIIARQELRALSENALARWRGKTCWYRLPVLPAHSNTYRAGKCASGARTGRWRWRKALKYE